MIPASLQDSVLSVVGLDTVHLSHTFARYAKPNAVHTEATGTAVGHNPTNFATIYGGSGVTTASTIPVGIIAEGSMTNVLSDLKSFASTNGLAAVATQVVGSGGSDTSGDVEWDLDSQDIVGMSGGVQKPDRLLRHHLADRCQPHRRLQRGGERITNAVKVPSTSRWASAKPMRSRRARPPLKTQSSSRPSRRARPSRYPRAIPAPTNAAPAASPRAGRPARSMWSRPAVLSCTPPAPRPGPARRCGTTSARVKARPVAARARSSRCRAGR